jgi:Flp pilus assembly protein TadB
MYILLVRGPPITLTCDCGERREVPYGARWQCEACGRTWDTNRIPADEYEAVRRLKRRFTLVPLAVTAVVALTIGLFVALGRIYAIVLLPLGLSMWVILVRPAQRRRLRAKLDALPEWKIKPE